MTPHDPERCATCSGKRHHPDEPTPLYRLVEVLTEIVRRARRETK